MELVLFLFLAGAGMPAQSQAAVDPGMVVGRIYHIEGDLLRYIPDENDWVAVVNDAPFGREDTLYSGTTGKSELIVPNGTLIRTGNNTQIQFIALDQDLTQADVASGVGRFYNRGTNTVVKVTSPFGDVLAYSDTAFDFYVGENSVEVVALKGTVSFVHAETGTRYDVGAGASSILADQQQVSSGDGAADPGWDRWNASRDHFWTGKTRSRGRSAEYLPPDLRDQSYALEENGRWDKVNYDGSDRWFWRPTIVSVGWSPFTVGRWTDWYGDQTWIPAEPFGYVTHHYGNWIYAHDYWYWAPPVVSVRVGFPLLDIGYYWYPGRVSWIHTGIHLGWIPLAPQETYYSRRRWGGPHTVVVNNINITQININVRDYAYANHAVVINRNNFYGVNDYRKHRLAKVDRNMIINNYRGAPIVNNTVIKNYSAIKQRHNFSNMTVKGKPHNTVTGRIKRNQAVIQESRYEKASAVRERAKKIPEGSVNRKARIEAPRGVNYIVPAGEVNRPKSEIKLRKNEIRSKDTSRIRETPQTRQERITPERESPREWVRQPERAKPTAPAELEKGKQSAQPGEKQKIRQPTRPERMEQQGTVRHDGSMQRQERVTPKRESPRERLRQPERTKPAAPEELKKGKQVIEPGETQKVRQPAGPQQMEQQVPARSGHSLQRERGTPKRESLREKVLQPERAKPAVPAKLKKEKRAVEPAETKEIPAEDSDGRQDPSDSQDPKQTKPWRRP